jgi:hypothetical protein
MGFFIADDIGPIDMMLGLEQIFFDWLSRRLFRDAGSFFGATGGFFGAALFRLLSPCASTGSTGAAGALILPSSMLIVNDGIAKIASL